jgi:hypothetical protein
MANRTIGISDELAAYVVAVGTREPEVSVCLLPLADGVTLDRRR